jgi:hypothetical protein
VNDFSFNSGTLPFQGLSYRIQCPLNRCNLRIKEIIELAQRVTVAGELVKKRANLLAATLTDAKQPQPAKPH